MFKNPKLKVVITWFLIIQIIAFIGACTDAFIQIPRLGLDSPFPIFSTVGICVGNIVGILYLITRPNPSDLSSDAKSIQLMVVSFNFIFPFLNLFGTLLGWVLSFISLYLLAQFFTFPIF